ncbi:MAG: hypothetical protein NE334_15250 [Lentisphaeraceae bacterium]|nr:hypothetical protein [Lentisphaeraceae bacterium]
MLKYIAIVLLCCNLVHAEEGQFKKDFETERFEEAYEAIDSKDIERVRRLFSAEPKAILRTVYDLSIRWALNTDYYDFISFEFNWDKIVKLINQEYPDFHEKLFLQEERFLIAQSLIDYPYKEYLGEFPDLFTNIKDFPKRLSWIQEIRSLRFLRRNQNKDGSWGTRNKVYCTSVAMLTFMYTGETHFSKKYGESFKLGMKYLLKSQPSKNGIDLYMWCLAEGFSFTAMTILEKRIAEVLPMFEKNLLKIDEFESAPIKFFQQNLAVRALYYSGDENFGFESYREELVKLTKDYPEKLLISAVTYQLNIKYNTDGLSKNFDKSYLDANLNGWDDLIFMWGMGRRGRGYKNFRDTWKEKSKALKSRERIYEFSKKFTDFENRLLSLSFPTLIEFSTIYSRHFRMHYRVPTHDKQKEALNEEGLDLID